MRSKGKRHSRGLTLLESLMLVTVLSIISAGTGKALMAITKVPGQTEVTLQQETALVSKLEQMRSTSFDSLPIGTAVSPYSDNGVFVDIALADPTGGNSPSTNWKSVTVRNNSNRQLVLLVCKP